MEEMEEFTSLASLILAICKDSDGPAFIQNRFCLSVRVQRLMLRS